MTDPEHPAPGDRPAELRAEIAELEAELAWMRPANRIMRKHLRRAPELRDRGADAAAFAPYLEELRTLRPELEAVQAAELLLPLTHGRRGYSDALISQTAGKIRRLERELRAIEEKS
ncbi:hypothetical protein [Celeribacter sp.]|uniref:hypothetical protein n=1 Tax=Celeribacter sp. TaxID=1890673 RepID=UPI003A8CF0E8